jgi:hypothetical protein
MSGINTVGLWSSKFCLLIDCCKYLRGKGLLLAGVMVACLALNQLIHVRIVGEQFLILFNMARSSIGLGYHSFTVGRGVQFPYGLLIFGWFIFICFIEFMAYPVDSGLEFSKLNVEGSIPSWAILCTRVSKVECLPYMQDGAGSSPAGCTNLYVADAGNINKTPNLMGRVRFSGDMFF